MIDIKVRKLEVEKMDEILENPKTATAKNLLASISKEILNPEMAAFASSVPPGETHGGQLLSLAAAGGLWW